MECIEILKKLDKAEKRQLTHWINSPAHNKREDVQQLYDYLKHILLKKHTTIDKQAAWKAISPSRPYDDAKFRQINFFLMKTVKAFLAYRKMLNDGYQEQLYTTEALEELGLNKMAEHEIRVLEKQVSDLENYHAWEQKNGLTIQKFKLLQQNKGRTKALNFEPIFSTLDYAYYSKKLRFMCSWASYKNIRKDDNEENFGKVIINHIKVNNLYHIPSIGFYYYCFLALMGKGETDKYFMEMQQILETKIHLFPPQEARELYLFAINYIIKYINKGSQWHLEQAFLLYKNGIEQKILLDEGKISPWTFRNVVSAGLRLKKYEWIEQFTAKGEAYLQPQHRSMIQESIAKLHYEKKDYKKALQLLTQVDFKDILQQLTCKTLLLKIYYEQQEIDALEALIHSMKVFIRRKVTMGYHKEVYSNIIKMIEKMLRLSPSDKANKAMLKTQIMATKALTEKQWLLQQLDNL